MRRQGEGCMDVYVYNVMPQSCGERVERGSAARSTQSLNGVDAGLLLMTVQSIDSSRNVTGNGCYFFGRTHIMQLLYEFFPWQIRRPAELSPLEHFKTRVHFLFTQGLEPQRENSLAYPVRKRPLIGDVAR